MARPSSRWWTRVRRARPKCFPARCATCTGEDRGSRTFGKGLVRDAAAAGQRRFGQAHHRALLHAQRQVDQGVGIVPDVVLKPDKATTDKDAGGRRRALHRGFPARAFARRGRGRCRHQRRRRCPAIRRSPRRCRNSRGRWRRWNKPKGSSRGITCSPGKRSAQEASYNEDHPGAACGLTRATLLNGPVAQAAPTPKGCRPVGFSEAPARVIASTTNRSGDSALVPSSSHRTTSWQMDVGGFPSQTCLDTMPRRRNVADGSWP